MNLYKCIHSYICPSGHLYKHGDTITADTYNNLPAEEKKNFTPVQSFYEKVAKII